MPSGFAFPPGGRSVERSVKSSASLIHCRKNWLFFGSDYGGQRLAILASFTMTYQQFGFNLWTYLKGTLTQLLPTTSDRLATLLPTSVEK